MQIKSNKGIIPLGVQGAIVRKIGTQRAQLFGINLSYLMENINDLNDYKEVNYTSIVKPKQQKMITDLILAYRNKFHNVKNIGDDLSHTKFFIACFLLRVCREQREKIPSNFDELTDLIGVQCVEILCEGTGYFQKSEGKDLCLKIFELVKQSEATEPLP